MINIELYTCRSIVGCVGKNSDREGKKQSQDNQRFEASHALISLLELVRFVVRIDVFDS